MLDIHADGNGLPQDGSPDETLQILEAGTGHGALTLHLARAVHVANNHMHAQQVNLPRKEIRRNFWQRLLHRIRGPPDDSFKGPMEERDLLESSRSAVLHSVDIFQKHSDHAKKIVQGFRRGLYAKDVEFYVGNVSDWVNHRLEGRRTSGLDAEDLPFLNHAFLDLPSSHRHLQTVASALRVNGNLITLNPSITQITESVEIIKRRRLPLTMDRVLELGPNMTGGKEWDVRMVKPKNVDLLQDVATLPSEQNPAKPADPMKAPVDAETITSTREIESQVAPPTENTEGVHKDWAMVCRPKVGLRVIGGAFIGVWKKIRVNL